MIIVGLMSGTSADGIDAALCEITGEPPQLQARIIHALTEPYTRDQRQRILNGCDPQASRVDALCQLHFELGTWCADAVEKVITQAGMKPADVDLVGAHGHTFWHHVLPDGHVGATLQLTEAAVIAERTGITTINNLRARDVAAGGQGAPLTGYADWLLLRHPTHWRAIQNIGGMGNVTFLPPLNDTQHMPIAFDTGPGNALMDIAAQALSDGAFTYDKDGHMAAGGRVDEEWLEKHLQHPYYARELPKTTGRELFGTAMALELVAEGKQRGLRADDIMATITMLTAGSIADAYRRFAPGQIQEVILGGGGARNPALVTALAALLSPASVKTHEDIGLDSDFKEALVFALLAYESWHGRPGQHPSLTGANHPVILGQITPGNNYAALLRRTWCGV
ncbi:MAG: anhydro-N-acetylmuramic acid kinase [Anaerolineae bacterium]|nr:anhydro-N-acetylmuramic acid kinase [Anaerolineae bacterium]